MKQHLGLRDILLALGVVCTWGVNFVVIKLGLQDLPPVLFTALRFSCAALPLVFFIKPPAVAWRYVLAYGMFQFALQFTLLFTGIKLGLPAGLSSLVIQLQAFFTIGLAVLALGERPRTFQLLGAVTAFAGMGLVAAYLEGQATLLGFVLVVLGGLCWACANIVTRKMGPVNALSLVGWGALVSVLPLFAASWWMEGGAAWQLAAQRFSATTLAAVLFNAWPNTLVGFGIWAYLVRKYEAATIAPFTLLVPVAGMASAAFFLGEAITWWKIAAGALVLGGLALNQFGARAWESLRWNPTTTTKEPLP
jgi:O-acetylserine/cysteine efflux transporter